MMVVIHELSFAFTCDNWLLVGVGLDNVLAVLDMRDVHMDPLDAAAWFVGVPGFVVGEVVGDVLVFFDSSGESVSRALRVDDCCTEPHSFGALSSTVMDGFPHSKCC